MEMTPDTINGLFEIAGAVFVSRDIQLLAKHKTVKGKGLGSNIFFSCWGMWNLYYYPTLDQWMSFIGAILLVATNLIWFLMALYYIRQEKIQEDLVLQINEGATRMRMAGAKEIV